MTDAHDNAQDDKAILEKLKRKRPVIKESLRLLTLTVKTPRGSILSATYEYLEAGHMKTIALAYGAVSAILTDPTEKEAAEWRKRSMAMDKDLSPFLPAALKIAEELARDERRRA